MQIKKPAAFALMAIPGLGICAGADEAREVMQSQLNQEVMATPFSSGDVKKATDYAEEAKKQKVVPVAQAPAYWVPGWTCANLTGYAYYNYTTYRDCVYFHHYYGRYWP